MRRPFLSPLLPPADRQLLEPCRCATMLTPSAIFLASCPRHLLSQRLPRFQSRLRRQIHHRPRFQSRLHHHLIHLHHLGHRCLYPFHHLIHLHHLGHRRLPPFHHHRRPPVHS